MLIFLIDTSPSMEGMRISAVNEMINLVCDEVSNTIPVNINGVGDVLTFDKHVEWVYPEPIKLTDINIQLDCKDHSSTRTDLALDSLNRILSRSSKFLPKSLVTPIIILITDGVSTFDIDRKIESLKRNYVFLSSLRFAFMLDDSCVKEELMKFTGDSKFVLKSVDLNYFKELFRFITLRSSQIVSNPVMKDVDGISGEGWVYETPGALFSEHLEIIKLLNIHFEQDFDIMSSGFER